jgi:UPF0716 protein FxsA
MLPALLILFVLVPIAELAVIIQVGQWLGLLPTLALLVADSVLGSLLMRSQGRAAWRRFGEALRAGRPPAREVLDGVLVIAGGALLLTPGFLTDVLGVAFLLPPTRAVIRRLLVRRLAGRMVASLAGRGSGPIRGGFGFGFGPTRGRYDVDGSAHDVEPEPRPPLGGGRAPGSSGA